MSFKFGTADLRFHANVIKAGGQIDVEKVISLLKSLGNGGRKIFHFPMMAEPFIGVIKSLFKLLYRNLGVVLCVISAVKSCKRLSALPGSPAAALFGSSESSFTIVSQKSKVMAGINGSASFPDL